MGAQTEGLQAAVGSSDPAAVPQELGTARMPAHPFLAPVAAAMGEEVARAVAVAVVAAPGATARLPAARALIYAGDGPDGSDLPGGGVVAGGGAPASTANANANGVDGTRPAANGALPARPAPNLFTELGAPTEPSNTPTLPPTTTFDTAAPSRERQLTAFTRYLADPAREGLRLDVYLDSRGIPTVGVGHQVLPEDNLRVGDRITQAQSDAFLRRDAERALDAARRQMTQAGITDSNFLNPLASVNFQLGTNWNQPPNGFTRTWADIMRGDYNQAAAEVGQSRWATQTPVRVQQFQNALRALPSRQ